MIGSPTLHQLLKYAVVGGSINLLVYVSFIFIHSVQLGIDDTLALFACSIFAMPIAYVLNRKWVFESNANIRKEQNKFAYVYLSGAVIGLAISKFFWIFLPFDIRLTQAIAMIAIAISSFVSQKLWTFKN